MIIYSTAQDIIEESIKQLKWDNQSAMYDLRDEALDYYTYNNTAKYIDQFFSGTLQQEIPIYNVNLTKKLINRISLVYKDAPIRDVENDNYYELTSDKDWKMKSFERVHNLLGTIAVHVCWEDDQIAYHPIMNFCPVMDPYNPLRPIGITYPLNKSTADWRNTEEDLYVYWSAEEHYMFDSTGRKIQVNEENINPYGILPFVFIQPNSMVDEFWNEGAMDIALGNKQIDIAMTMLQHHIRTAGGQYVIEGRVDANNIQLGLNKVVVLDEGNMTNISSNTSVNDIKEGIEFQLKTIAFNNNLNFDFGLSGSKSGVALKIENLELLEAREDEVEKWRRAEKQMYKIEREIIQIETGFSLPDQISVDYSEVKFPDFEREREEWDWKFANGIADKYDYMMAHDPDKFPDRQAAIDFLDEKTLTSDNKQNIFKLNRNNNGQNTNQLPRQDNNS
tara:strand:+ start:22295 stop:23638 length:1344 start_codon:yes stop_codon:yes gene_type:complete